jgi:hypothetical protein
MTLLHAFCLLRIRINCCGVKLSIVQFLIFVARAPSHTDLVVHRWRRRPAPRAGELAEFFQRNVLGPSNLLTSLKLALELNLLILEFVCCSALQKLLARVSSISRVRLGNINSFVAKGRLEFLYVTTRRGRH